MSKSKNGVLFDKKNDSLPENGLPDGWAWATMSELCDYVTSGARNWSKYYADTGVLFVRTQNFNKNRLELDGVARMDVPENKRSPRTRIEKGDLLYIVTGANVGKCALVQHDLEEAYPSQSVALVKLKDKTLGPYLQKCSIAPGFGKKQLDEMAYGMGRPVLNLDNIRELKFPIAPPGEQKRIVDKIEELFSDLDAGVAALERARANLRRYRASVLKAAVEGRLTTEWRAANPDVEPAHELLARILRQRREHWEQQQLATYESKGKLPPKNWRDKYKPPAAPDTTNLPDLPTGWCWATPDQLAAPEDYSLAIGPFGSNLKVSDYTEVGVPLVFVRNIRSGEFGENGKKAKYVSAEKSQELIAHSIDAGDVLITKMGEPPGDATLYPIGQPHAIITADCIKFRPSDLVGDPNFFVWAINSMPVHNQILKITRGVAQKKVSLGRFSKVAFPLPPLLEQLELLKQLEDSAMIATKIEETFIRSQKRSERLRQSILKRAFEGALVNFEDHRFGQTSPIYGHQANEENCVVINGRSNTKN